MVALGLVTDPKIIFFAVAAVVLEADVAVARRLPAVAVLTVQVPDNDEEVKDEPVTLNPAGVEQAPEAVVQI